MAQNPKLSQKSVNTEADALGALFDGGYLRIYNGAQPKNPDEKLSDQTLLAELRLPAKCFPPAKDGVLMANSIAAVSAIATAPSNRQASWFRAFHSDGTSPLLDGTVGTKQSDSDCKINTTAIQINAAVEIGSLVLMLAK